MSTKDPYPHPRRVLAVVAIVVTAVIAMLAVPALSQRDPDYAAARAAGAVGEKPDGYLAIVGVATPGLRKLVNDINIKRRANYTERAVAQHVTIEEYAFTQGCILIARTVPGEQYQDPSGVWRVRGTEAPLRDSRCP